MATKDELEEDINERLELDIEWSRLKKGDLKKIHEGLDEENFVKKFVAQLADKKSGSLVKDQIMSWEPGMFIGMATKMQEGNIPLSNLFGSNSEEEVEWDDV